MSVIYVMIPMALLLVGFAIWAMVWAIRSGQFDELESHGWTPVLDDDERPVRDGEAGQAKTSESGNGRAEGAERDADSAPGDRIDRTE